MSRKWLKWTVIIFLALLVLGLSGLLGVWLYIKQRNTNWLRTAQSAFVDGDWKKAQEYYEFYLIQDPSNLEALTNYAQASLNRLESRTVMLRKAATAYTQILEYYPDRNELRLQLLDIFDRLGAWSELEYRADEFLEEQPGQPDFEHFRAKALDQLGQIDEAEAAYKSLIQQRVAKPEVYTRLASLYADRDRHREADETIATGLTAYGDTLEMRLELAKYYVQQRDIPRLQEQVEAAAKIDPNHSGVLTWRARLAAHEGNWQEAIAQGEKALERDPENGEAYIILANAYRGAKRLSDAIAVLEKAAPTLQVDESEILVTLADTLIDERRLDEARATIERYENAHPQRQSVLEYLRARVLLIEGDAKGASELLASVVQQQPDLLRAQYFLAVAYMEAGDDRLAKSTLEGYLRRNSDDARGRALLARLTGALPNAGDVQTLAARVLADTNAGADELLQSAARLSAKGRKQGFTEQDVVTALELLERAIRQSPSNPNAYSALIDFNISIGDADAAKAALERAETAGIAESALLLSKARLAILERKPDTLQSLFDTFVAQPGLSAEAVLPWVLSAAGNGMADNALSMIAQTLAVLDQAPELEVQRVALTARYKSIDRALNLLDDLRANADAAYDLGPALIEIAQQLLAQDSKRVDEVKRLVDEARKLDPESVAVKVLDAYVALLQDPPDRKGAEERFRAVLALDEANIPALMGMARIATLDRDFPLAEGYLRRAVEHAPQLTRAPIDLAEIYIRLRRFAEAQQLLDQVIRQDAANPRAIELAAIARIDAGQAGEAQPLLDQLQALSTGNPALEKRLAILRERIAMASSSPAEVESQLRADYQANPDSAEAANALAVALLGQQRVDEAVDILADYAESHAAQVDGWLSLARLHLMIDSPAHTADASTALTRALLLEPDNLRALRDMIDLQMRRGDAASALTLADRFLAQANDDAPVLYRKAVLLQNSPERIEEALAAIDTAVRLDDQPEYRALRGVLYLDSGKLEQALADLESVAQGLPNLTAQLELALAQAYHEKGDRDSAAQHFNAVRQKVQQGEEVDRNRFDALAKEMNAAT